MHFYIAFQYTEILINFILRKIKFSFYYILNHYWLNYLINAVFSLTFANRFFIAENILKLIFYQFSWNKLIFNTIGISVEIWILIIIIRFSYQGLVILQERQIKKTCIFPFIWFCKTDNYFLLQVKYMKLFKSFFNHNCVNFFKIKK